MRDSHSLRRVDHASLESVPKVSLDTLDLWEQLWGIGNAVEPHFSGSNVHGRHGNYVIAERREVRE